QHRGNGAKQADGLRQSQSLPGWVDYTSTSARTARPRREGKMTLRLHSLAALSYCVAACGVAAAQTPKDVEWPTYGADLANTRYRPLDQINAGNFNRLELAWSFKADNLGPRPEYKLEGTPLMVKGVLYATGGT